jgi:hypothetical protein
MKIHANPFERITSAISDVPFLAAVLLLQR